MNFPANLKYTATHEWVKELGGGVYEIGLSDFAQKELGDIVFVNLPQAGDALSAGTSFADLESVKAVTDIFSPVTGTVKEANSAVLDSPESINKDCYGAWLIRAEGKPEGGLLDAAAYEASLPKK
ncbi:MAG: glycine cleavage system protein GcvH [Spirochaetaceae bacterium]|jgi:glycine cleavage system H protein|nr:glycine cleavage system protein GcvH [Spirochaetaceae bacterium]